VDASNIILLYQYKLRDKARGLVFDKESCQYWPDCQKSTTRYGKFMENNNNRILDDYGAQDGGLYLYDWTFVGLKFCMKLLVSKGLDCPDNCRT